MIPLHAPIIEEDDINSVIKNLQSGWISTSSKDILARAMAQEDITVQHSASAQTAAFDVQNRCLILPVWKDMDNAMYDMLHNQHLGLQQNHTLALFPYYM